MQSSRTSLLLPAALVASSACHQAPAQEVGFGALKRVFNVTESVLHSGLGGDDGVWGVAYVDGLLYATGSPPDEAADGSGDDGEAARIYAIDPVTTTVVGWFSIPAFEIAFDLASDLEGNLLVAGPEGAALYDRAGNRLSGLRSEAGTVPLPLDGNGQPLIRGPSLGPGTALDRYAGIAFDPAGDGGNGSIYVGDTPAQDSIFEVRIKDGRTVEEFANRGWTCAGLAFDPVTGNLWCHSDDPLTIMELDTDNQLEPSGIAIDSIPLQPDRLARRAGGLEIVPGGAPGYFWESAHDLVSLSQSGADFIGFHRLHQIPGVPGYTESVLLGSTGQDPLSRTTPIPFGPGDTLNWGLDHNGRSNYGGPALHFINVGDDATRDGLTDLAFLGVPGNFPELLALSVISTPASQNALYQSSLVGDPDAVPPLPTGVTSVTLPGSFPFFPGLSIRLQSVYFDPNVANPWLPFLASNEIRFEGEM